jgi:hypothetical protein
VVSSVPSPLKPNWSKYKVDNGVGDTGSGVGDRGGGVGDTEDAGVKVRKRIEAILRMSAKKITAIALLFRIPTPGNQYRELFQQIRFTDDKFTIILNFFK